MKKIFIICIILFLVFSIYSCESILNDTIGGFTISIDASDGEYKDYIEVSWNIPDLTYEDADGNELNYEYDYLILKRDGSEILNTTNISTTYKDYASNYGVHNSYELIIYYKDIYNDAKSIEDSDEGFRIHKEIVQISSGIYDESSGVYTTSDGIDGSIFFEVYLQKGWTYHFWIKDAGGYAPTPKVYLYKSEDLMVEESLIDPEGAAYPEITYVAEKSGKFLLQVESTNQLNMCTYEFMTYHE